MARGPNEKRRSEKAEFLGSARQLMKETARVLGSEKIFPKRNRWLFGYEIMRIANQFHTEAIYANSIDVRTRQLMLERYQAQARALAWLKTLNAKMTLAVWIEDVNADYLAGWASLYQETWDRLKGAQSADLRRYGKHFGSLKAEEMREPVIASDPGMDLDGLLTRPTRTTSGTPIRPEL